MNIEDYREYYLSLGEDMEEKLPFTIMDIVVTASDEQLLQMKADYENGAEPDRLHMIEEGSAELAGRETKVLTDEEMARIAALDKGRSAFFSHQDPAIVEWFGQMVEERKKQGHYPASEKKAW